ncbi:MAG: A/G-specific adenine glycosylase [Candidatus Sumerlaeia bacterium]|nr:A/G-specific adenine glycosylase [Candidatus Sumerlaeia bacterium]
MSESIALGRSAFGAFRRALRQWYGANCRALPWRETPDAYAVWLSEAMLQQTTVRTVEPRWRRFLARYPTVQALAAAPLDDVVAEWSGLGYYARARNLHAAAQRVVADFGGRVPDSFEALLSLPGMGRYTAAAVASIAFGEAVAVVDANVERVVARLDAIADPVSQPATKRRLWDRAQELLDATHAGEWNQAVMELGALVCLPRNPQCGACPVARWCAGRATGEPTRYPVKARPAPLRETREVAVVLRRGERVLVLRRPAEGSFAGMWELPRGEALEGEPARDAAARIVRETTGLDCGPRALLLRLKHVVMRRRIELLVWSAESDGGRIRRSRHEAHEWIAPDEWLTRPLSTTQRQIALFLRDGRAPKRSTPPPDTDDGDLFGGS